MKTKDLEKNSKEKIVKDYDKIVKYVIKDMRLSHRFDDLYDIGIIGFVNGINTYNENKGYTYMTYLYDCIKNEIGKYLHYENCKRRKAEIVSLNKEINNIELIDLIPTYENYDEKLYLDEMLYLINRRLSFLNERDELIFKHLYGLDGYEELNSIELEKKYKMSRQNVQRIKERVLKMLKHDLLGNFYKSYQDLLLSKNKM